MILFVNACIRKESRTLKLARRVLSALPEDTVEGVRVTSHPVYDESDLDFRNQVAAMNLPSLPVFFEARQFARADTIVIAAPYWDLSFPALLKAYVEQINILNITFGYTPEGEPFPLCRARELIYVTTAGGHVQDTYGFGYIKALCETFYGIPKVTLVKAEGLDLIGADVDQLLEDAFAAWANR